MIVSLDDYRYARACGFDEECARAFARLQSGARDLIDFARLGQPPSVWDRLHAAFPDHFGGETKRAASVRLVFSDCAEPRLEVLR